MYISKQYALLVGILMANFVSVAQEKVIDLHMHLWDKEASLEMYQNHVDTLDFEVAQMGGILIAQQGIEETRAINDWVIELSKKHPKLFPIGSVHPYDGEAALEELRRISQLGVKIIKLHPITQQVSVDDERVIAFCQEAGALGLTVLVDNANFLKADDVESLLTLALQCGQTQFIYAHMGALNFRSWSILKLLKTVPNFYQNNIYFDISGTVTLVADSPIEEEFVWVLRSIGMDKILFGSDFPQWTVNETLEAIKKLGLTAEETEQIRYKNAMELLSK